MYRARQQKISKTCHSSKKYGVLPQEAEASAKSKQDAASNEKSAKNDDEDSDNDQPASSSSPVNVKTSIDNRPVKFLKAKLISVDCSKPPAAVLSVLRSGRVLKFRTTDYKSLAIIGADRLFLLLEKYFRQFELPRRRQDGWRPGLRRSPLTWSFPAVASKMSGSQISS